MVDVGDAVHEPHDPALERGGRVRPRVVEDAVAHLLGEVEPLDLEVLDHPQRVLVVVEAHAVALLQALVEHRLADVAEGRMAEIVAQADRLGEVLVQPQRAGHVAGDAARLERVRQPRAVVVALGRDEHLGLVLEAPERLAVHDPVAVALEGRAVVGVRLGLRAPGRIGAGRERREQLLRADRSAP